MREWIKIVEGKSYQETLADFKKTVPQYTFEITCDETHYRVELADISANDSLFEQVGHLRLTKEDQRWKIMSIYVDSIHRGRGAAEVMLRRAVDDLGPLGTSGVFSDIGKSLFQHLVSKGYANSIDHNKDFLIHF